MEASDRKSVIRDLCERHKKGDTKVFPDIIRQCIEGDFLADMVLAFQFEVAVTTIHRWSTGTSTPNPMIQPRMVEWIVKQLDVL
ncbi:hypothetical protein KBC54_00880 [Patescibacteria group bacterium]|nr:hypothetical protein [Patescibacteria group bacterium]